MNKASPLTLQDWLAHAERLHPKTIDMGLARVREVAERLALHVDCPVITVAGTNGKGSTCALLEAVLTQAGYRTGVYTSPHLVHFEERCRLRGQSAPSEELAAAMARVEAARGAVSLSYFEFTTLAILDVLARAGLDAVILEVGLGGRLDAVNLVDADCAIITSIDIDHAELLGDTREAIGREKAGIMRAGRPVVVSDPLPPDSVIEHAQAIGADLWLPGRDFRGTPQAGHERQQWNWQGRARRYAGLAYPALRGANQLTNAAGALAALEALRARLPVTAQAVRSGLALAVLPGRFQIVPGKPALVLDVAHNPHAVAALAASLDAMGFAPTTHAVFGAMADKDLAPMLARLDPLVDRWYFTDLPLARAARASDVQARWQAQTQRRDAASACFASPVEALRAAAVAADPAPSHAWLSSSFDCPDKVPPTRRGRLQQQLTPPRAWRRCAPVRATA